MERGAAQDILTATIASGSALSSAIQLREKVLCGIVMPAVWTAADVSLQVSLDGVNWLDVYDQNGNDIGITAPVAGRYMQIDPSMVSGLSCIRLQSGRPGVQVNQAQACAFTIISRRYYSL